MRYHIDVSYCGAVFDQLTRRRIDAAKLIFEQAVYECIASDGALDTERGHRAMRTAKRFGPLNLNPCTVQIGNWTISAVATR